MQINFEELKNAIIEVCVQILQNEELRQLIEKAHNFDELINILDNNSLTLTQKQIESCKLLVKNAIKENPHYGPTTKKSFEEIVNSNISPKEMVKRFVAYISTNDVGN